MKLRKFLLSICLLSLSTNLFCQTWTWYDYNSGGELQIRKGKGQNYIMYVGVSDGRERLFTSLDLIFIENADAKVWEPMIKRQLCESAKITKCAFYHISGTRNSEVLLMWISSKNNVCHDLYYTEWDEWNEVYHIGKSTVKCLNLKTK